MNRVFFKNINEDAYYNDDAINNVISYIYRLNETFQLPIFCYGCIEWPPTYDSLKSEYYMIRKLSRTNLPDQQIIHFIISFGIPAAYITARHHRFADDIAKLFGIEYQVCYAYHTDTKHPHFHYVVSATSYIPENLPLSPERMSQYQAQIHSLADKYDFKFLTEGAQNHV